MSLLSVERDTEILIDNKLRNLGWHNNPQSVNRNVYQQRVKTQEQRKKLQGMKPDYILYTSRSNRPLAVIEAKRQGRNIHEALRQGTEYAVRLDAPIVFATDGVFTKTIHAKVGKPLMLNGDELDELIRETLAVKYIATNEVSTLGKRVVQSRSELISIFVKVNSLLREEGLQQGLERFTEFANILFLKVLSEIEDGKEERGEKSFIDAAYRWNYFRDKKGPELLSYVSDTVLKWFSREYRDDNIFQPLQIKHPDNLRQIIDMLDDLQLTDINADIKGDAFEYFIRSYSASNASDLGEIFTPRHIVKTMVRLLKPKIGEMICDPFCGTGGMLIEAFKYLMDTMPRNRGNLNTLRTRTVYGAELTKTASIAKMNMILAGDGHNNIHRRDSLANAVDGKYDIVITNMPFAQRTRHGDLYDVPSRNGDIVCPQHCFRSLVDGGRMAIIVPEGFLSNTTKAYKDARSFLLNRATLKSIVSLPRGSFEPYNRSKTNILYFTNAKVSRTDKHYWFFDVRNDGYTLDKRRSRIPGGNDLDLVLSENHPERQTDPYLVSLGITRIDAQKARINQFILTAAHYRSVGLEPKYETVRLDELLEPASGDRIGDAANTPVMSITMEHGLVDQTEKFRKRVASNDISQYKKVYHNELVVGFPIDEGALGFQLKHPFAAVSPAYTVWHLKDANVDIEFLDILLRSQVMRDEYRLKMQGAVDRRRSIDKDVFLSIEIPMPPAHVRRAVVRKRKQMDEAADRINALEREVATGLGELWETPNEDRHDAEIAQEMLAAINANHEPLVSGKALEHRLADLVRE